MTVPISTRTVQDAVTHVVKQFGDEAGVQISTEDIIRWINQACVEIVAKNGILETVMLATGVSGQRIYDPPVDILEMRSVEYGNRVLTAISREDAAEVAGNSMGTTGTPEYWSMWANKIYLWPTPSTADDLTIYYVRIPAQVQDLVEPIPVPDRYFERVTEYVLSKAYELDEDWQAHDTQLKRFEDKLQEANNAEFISGGSYPVITEVGYD